jgi:DNA-directed RNA polymerase sigma subunit (sigma70/sigma32)
MQNKKDRPQQASMTQQEVAEVLGISRAAVAELEKKALRKLRNALKSKGYTLRDFFGRD